MSDSVNMAAAASRLRDEFPVLRTQALADIARMIRVVLDAFGYTENDDMPAPIPLPWLRPTPDELDRRGIKSFLVRQRAWLCPVAGCGVLVMDEARDEHAREHFPA